MGSSLMAHYNFRKDIVDGEAGEKFITNWLCENANGKLLSDNIWQMKTK